MKTATARFRVPLVGSLLLVLALLAVPVGSTAAVFVSVDIAPPALPVYVQPPVPGPGYIWTPGYWAYGPGGYYWVPGTWVFAPYVGALWTPGYWGWGGAAFLWHAGYWGPHVGFYGGINYGFGYIGVGYHGGYWNGGAFSYNTAVTNVNVTNIHNTYNQAVVQNTALSRVSFNGGTGGVAAQPTAAERLAQSEQHLPATQLQTRHEQLASTNRAQLASVNHGTPSLPATPKVAAFKQPNAGTANAATAKVKQPYAGTASAATTANAAKVKQPYTGTANAAKGGQPPTTGQPKNLGAQNTPHPQGHVQTAPHPEVAHHEEGKTR